jgi:hypothetical protein
VVSELKRVKIDYNGGPAWGAKVTDAETGELIPNAYRVEFVLDANSGETPQVKIYAFAPIADVIGDASIHKICPHCGQEVSDAK